MHGYYFTENNGGADHIKGKYKHRTNISLDEDLKKEAQALFADFGLDLTTAITIFLKRSVQEGRIPFAIRKVAEPYAYEMYQPTEQSRVIKTIVDAERRMG